MTVLSDYARTSYKKIQEIDHWSDSALSSTSPERLGGSFQL
jgi:hypothetical protein